METEAGWDSPVLGELEGPCSEERTATLRRMCGGKRSQCPHQPAPLPLYFPYVCPV